MAAYSTEFKKEYLGHITCELIRKLPLERPQTDVRFW